MNLLSQRLLDLVSPYEFTVIVLHDTPDADAIAAGWAIKHLLDELTISNPRLIAGGTLLRSENRRLVDLLEPPLEMLDEYRLLSEVALVFVDCGPEVSEHLLDEQLYSPVAVIHHHEPPPGQRGLANRSIEEKLTAGPPLVDIRLDVAATSTIATTYLIEQEIEPPEALATALLYGIRDETRGHAPQYSFEDKRVIEWLVSRADLATLADIENAPLNSAYYGDFALALQNCVMFQDAGFCMLPRAACPETIAEVADFLIRHEKLSRVCCAAVHQQTVVISVRTDVGGGNATALLRETIDGIGRGAGHTYRAGGKLFESTTKKQVPTLTQLELQKRWLHACRLHNPEAQRLLSLDEIANSLDSARQAQS